MHNQTSAIESVVPDIYFLWFFWVRTVLCCVHRHTRTFIHAHTRIHPCTYTCTHKDTHRHEHIETLVAIHRGIMSSSVTIVVWTCTDWSDKCFHSCTSHSMNCFGLGYHTTETPLWPQQQFVDFSCNMGNFKCTWTKSTASYFLRFLTYRDPFVEAPFCLRGYLKLLIVDPCWYQASVFHSWCVAFIINICQGYFHNRFEYFLPLH